MKNVRMKNLWLCVLLLSKTFMVELSSVKFVQLIDHKSYAVSIIQKTMSRVEQQHWCNLKIDDMTFSVSENVLGDIISAVIDLKNGFVLSIQKIDIIESTIGQAWLPVRGNTTTVEVRATARMHNVSIGFDVTTKPSASDHISHTTGLIIYPEIQFLFTITKHLFTDDLTVNVVSNLLRTTNLPEFLPENNITKVFTVLYSWDSLSPSLSRWATDIFTPITHQIATEEVQFPRICYDCSV